MGTSSVKTAHTDAPDFRALFEASPGLYLVLSPAFTIVGASDSYLRATLTERQDILQRGLFDVFPDNPEDLTADGTSNLRASLERVLRNGVPDRMAVQKYDIRRPETEGGGFEVRYWSPVNSPVFGADKQVKYIIHRVDDVTDLVRLKENGSSHKNGGPREAELLEVFVRAQEVEAANSELRARNEQLATEGDEKLRALFDVMPQIGWSARPDGYRDFYNRCWYSYTGTNYEQMCGWGWKTIHDPAVLPSVEKEWEKALRQGTSFSMEFPLRRHDGAFRWFLSQVNPIRNAEGTIVRWVGINTDIDDQRRATQAGEKLRKVTEEERDGFFSMALDLLAIGSFDGYFIRLNPAWQHTLGWTLEELMSKHWIEFVHPEDKQATLDASGRLNSGLAVVSFENRYRCKDGSYKSLHWKVIPSVERRIVYAAARDITEAIASADALRDVSESLETTLQSIGDGVIATDATGLVIRMNPVAERLTGWTLAEAKGKAFHDIFTIVNEDTRRALEDPIERSLREGATVGLPSRTLFIRRDGTEVVIADSCAPIRNASGAVTGAVLVFRDLTDERSAAAVQAKYQKQLVLSDRMASVGTLAAGVAHEINNPLTYITANIATAIEEVRALAGGSASARMKDLEEILVEAREGATRVAKIVRGLKTFSRIEEERLGVVDLVPVLELSINMAFNEIRHRARLVKDYGKIPYVDADDARLGQVFINLLVNAAQAFPEGNSEGNEIRIVTSTDDTGRAVVEVRDTGPGMAPALLGRIFDPFFTTKPVGIGTGLGLAICHNIVTGMGGDISVLSEVGRGTTFRVVMPASSGGAPFVPEMVQYAKTGTRFPARVLVIDDEPAVGFAVRRVLRDHEVTVVTTAQHGLDLLAGAKEFDVILSDLMMPGMSGIEFYTALARLHPKMASRVVFVTGGAFTPEANAFLDRVTNERMEKPFDLHQLREMVQKFVKGAKPQAGASSKPGTRPALS
jgi:PAS domain S-box-containing protein